MKAQAPPPQRQAPHSRANTNRRFRYSSRAIKDNRSGTTAQHAAFASIQRSARVLAQRQALDTIHDGRRIVPYYQLSAVLHDYGDVFSGQAARPGSLA